MKKDLKLKNYFKIANHQALISKKTKSRNMTDSEECYVAVKYLILLTLLGKLVTSNKSNENLKKTFSKSSKTF